VLHTVRQCLITLWPTENAPRQSARKPYQSKLDEIGTEAKLDEIEGQK